MLSQKLFYFLLIIGVNSCDFGSWTEWSDCSATCGTQAERTRLKECECPEGSGYNDYSSDTAYDSNNSNECEFGELFTEVENCGYAACPSSNWSNWSSSGCSEPCGGGVELLERECIIDGEEVSDDHCIGPSQNMIACNTDPCDGTTESTTSMSTTSTETSTTPTTSTSTTETTSTSTTETTTTTESTTWSRFSTDTSSTTDYNDDYTSTTSTEDTTTTFSYPYHSTTSTEFTTTQSTEDFTTTSTEPPSTITFIDSDTAEGHWMSWSNWSACTRSCDGGFRTRSRLAVATPFYAITSEISPGFDYYNGDYEYQDEVCNEISCGKCVYQQWSTWTTCTDKCSTGTASRARQCVCNGVSSYCNGDGTFSENSNNANSLSYEKLTSGSYQHQHEFCEAFNYDEDCNDESDIPLVKEIKIKFVSYVIKARNEARKYFRGDGFLTPTDQDKWDILFIAVQIYIQKYLGTLLDYAPNEWTHQPANNLITDHDTDSASEILIPISTEIIFLADANREPQSLQDFVISINNVYKKFPKLSDYNANQSRRISRKRRDTNTDTIVSDNNPIVEEANFFDNKNLQNSPNDIASVTSIIPDMALSSLLSTFSADSSSTANFLLTGCHCMKFGSYSDQLMKLLGGPNHINDLDEQCQKFFGQTRCVFLEGGKCQNFPERKKIPYLVEYDSDTSNLLCDSVATWQPDANNEEIACINDLCLIHNYYFQGILDYINTQGSIIANPGIDVNNLVDNQCIHPGNSHTVTCTGEAPHLRFVKNP